MIYPQRVMLPIQSGTTADLSGRLAHFLKNLSYNDYNGCLERFKLKKASNGLYDLQHLTYAILTQCDHKTHEGGGKET